MMPDTAAHKAPHACPVCGDAAHISLLCQTDGADVFTCATCQADHVFPAPSAQALAAYYDRREWFEGGEKGGYENYDAQTGWSVDLMTSILARFAGQTGLSILDVGCGYGTHLAAAAKLGWKCFGVEPSSHARGIARERLGGTAQIVESVGELIPHEFDVVLMLDVIEHLPSPYPTFYQLFSIGAITAKTLVVITTPNAGSVEARRDPGAWPYRHPASHLVHYSPPALEFLLRRLHFKDTEIRGLTAGTETSTDLPNCAGLLVMAKGSDFAEFMRERYVPGTWSKLAEYEHLPRYALAKTLAAGKSVLDFGCGTGYGAALMAETAKQVTGLDIDAAALEWARASHRNPRLQFQRHADLGATLPDASFDLVTCFEMIEHVDHATQKATVASIARLLREDGVLAISTPNPAVTALYGANPYHIREMNEAEFRDLLSPHFPHIRILRQFVRIGIALDQEGGDRTLTPDFIDPRVEAETKPLAFIALCSRKPVPEVPNRVLFDQDVDYIAQFMGKENVINRARLDAFERGETVHSLKGQFDQALSERNAVQGELQTTIRRLMSAETQVMDFEKRLIGREQELMAREQELMALEQKRAQEALAAANAYDLLHRTREEEHKSPRFLAKQLVRAVRARLRGKP